MINNSLATVKSLIEESTPHGTVINNYEEIGKARGYFGLLTIEPGRYAHKFVEDSTHIYIGKTKLDIKKGDVLLVRGGEYEVMYVDRPLWDAHAQIEVKKMGQQVSEMNLPIYYGSSDREYLTEMNMFGLNEEKLRERLFTGEFENVGGKIVIAYPKSFGKATIHINDEEVSNWEIEDMMVKGVIYYLYTKESALETITFKLS